jgi:hypothetical protein
MIISVRGGEGGECSVSGDGRLSGETREQEFGGHHGCFWECFLFSQVDFILSKISDLEHPFDNLIEEDLVFSISKTDIIV